METSFNCSTNFAEIASGGVPYELGSFGVPYTVVLVFLAFLMGLGKGGVPGSSTTSVALNSLLAPSGPGCLDATVALGVPITFLADVMVVVSYLKLARWDVILRLLPPTGLGVAVGTQLMGRLSESQARLLIGAVLLLILSFNAAQAFLVPKPSPPPAAATTTNTAAVAPRTGGRSVSAQEEALKRARSMSPEVAKKAAAASPSSSSSSKKSEQEEKETLEVPAYATSIWFTFLIGVVGGFATILTNSMGPMLNVYLLTLRLAPTSFVGTRATFFTCINTLKLVQRVYAGTLSLDLLKYGAAYGVVAILGVKCSTFIIPRMSKALFMKLEYTVMTFAALKLIDKGLGLGYL